MTRNDQTSFNKSDLERIGEAETVLGIPYDDTDKEVLILNLLKSLKNAGWSNRDIASYIPGSAGSISFVLRGVRSPPLDWYDGLIEANYQFAWMD